MRKLDFDLILLKILFKSNLLSFIPWRNFPTKSRLNFIFFLYSLSHNLTFLPLSSLIFPHFSFIQLTQFSKKIIFFSSYQLKLYVTLLSIVETMGNFVVGSASEAASEPVAPTEQHRRIITQERNHRHHHIQYTSNQKSGAQPISSLSGKCMGFARKHFTM